MKWAVFIAVGCAIFATSDIQAKSFQFHVNIGPNSYSDSNTKGQTIHQTSTSANSFQGAINIVGKGDNSQTIKQTQSSNVVATP